MARTKALLLAGGLGTRLQPLTLTVPKCLIPIAGKPMLDYWFDALAVAGISDVLVNTHHLADQVRDHIAAINAKGGLRVTEAFEPALLGSAGTLHANRGWADDADSIVVIYADNLSTIDLTDLVAFHTGQNAPMTMALFHTPYPSQCGIATLDAQGTITAFVEKPEQPQSDLANAGIYVMDADLWRAVADLNVFDFGFDVLPRYVGQMQGYPFDGYHRDIGNPASLDQANRDAPRLFPAQ